MALSKRLQTLMDLVKYPSVADIGCGHGLLAAGLLQTGKAEWVVAADLNAAPLETAKENLGRLGLNTRACVRLGAGLAPISPSETKTCVIAGMGGRNIVQILDDSPETARAFKQLILSPERDAALVRRYLHGNAFTITGEYLLRERGRFYIIIDVCPGEEPPYDDLGYAFGKSLLLKKDVVLYKYIKHELAKTERRLGECVCKDVPKPTALTNYRALCARALESFFD